MIFQVDVGFSLHRPVRPDQYVSRVTVEADSAGEAELDAIAMVASHVAMVTSSQVLV